MYPIVPKTESAIPQTPKMKFLAKTVGRLLVFAESLILDVSKGLECVSDMCSSVVCIWIILGLGLSALPYSYHKPVKKHTLYYHENKKNYSFIFINNTKLY